MASMSSSLSVLPAMGHNRGREGVMHALGQRVLINAARKLGGPELLAKHLGVEDAALRAWIDGEQVPPAEIIHKAADLVLGDGLN